MPRQKQLLHIFPSFAVGGSQMRFAQLLRLHANRYWHTVVSLNGNYSMAELLPPDSMTLRKVRNTKHNVLGSYREFRKVLEVAQPDVLITYNWGAIEWAAFNRFTKRTRHLHIEDGFGPEEASRQLKRRVWARRLALGGQNTSVILPSQTLEKIARDVWKLPQSKLNYIANGIECARFAGRLEKTTRSITIGTVATLRREKNIGRLVETFAKIKSRDASDQLRLIIVGDGPERISLEAQVKRLGISQQVQFAGNSRTPEDWLRKIDIFALSSDTEQMPLGILEAMAAGLPIAATAVGDVSKMVAEANAPFVMPAGPAFQLALEMLVNDPDLRRRLGVENARRARELYDETKMAARYAELIG